MIKGFYFSLSFNWKPKERSILEISERLICLFQDLSLFDERFLFPKYISQNNKEIDINLNTADASNLFASQYLASVKINIIENNGNENISIDFKRDFGFTGSFKFGNHDIVLSGRLGSSIAEGLSFGFPQYFEEPMSWYFQLLKVCVNNTNSFFGAMQLKTIDITSQIIDLKYPLGILTYFAKSLSLNISECLGEIEIEESENGSYFIFTRNSVTTTKESFDLFKYNLIEANNSIRNCDPKILRKSHYPF